MNDIHHLFTLLEGAWIGEGQGGYSTINSFEYREMLSFTQRDGKSLAYEQRTQKHIEGQTGYVISHWENGFIRVLDSGELEMVNVQSGGRGEVLIGNIETSVNVIRIRFTSKTIMNDPRMISSMRVFELEGDTLRYEMEMQTTKTNQLIQHLKIALKRIK